MYVYVNKYIVVSNVRPLAICFCWVKGSHPCNKKTGHSAGCRLVLCLYSVLSDVAKIRALLGDTFGDTAVVPLFPSRPNQIVRLVLPGALRVRLP